MGSCCFTPRRTQFLWWYWLLLASIVGIPMLLAAWYVARHPYIDDEARQKVGKRGSAIFWYSSLVMAGLVFLVTWLFFQKYHPASVYSYSPTEVGTFGTLIISFLGGVALLTAGDDRGGRRKARIIIPLLATSLLFLLTIFSATSITEFFLLLAVCLFAAHFIGLFSEKPTQRTAWQALLMLILSTFLFWGSAKYGKIANLYLNRLVQGKVPDREQIALYMDNRY